jgi:hypothetical protein
MNELEKLEVVYVMEKQAYASKVIQGGLSLGRRLFPFLGKSVARQAPQKLLPAAGKAYTGGTRIMLGPQGKSLLKGMGLTGAGAGLYAGGNYQGQRQGASKGIAQTLHSMENLPMWQRMLWAMAPQGGTQRALEQVPQQLQKRTRNAYDNLVGY